MCKLNIETMNSNTPAYSVPEEIANAVSHGIGAMLSAAGLALLVYMAALDNDPNRLFAYIIYGISLVSLFLASTLYHALTHEKAKSVFKLLDHCAIYLLIAGTYTPLLAVNLTGTLGYSLLATIWLCALVGIVFKVRYGSKYKLVSLGTYLGMGFIALMFIHKIYAALELGGFILLCLGGLFYSLGVIFYVNKRIPFNHAIWHLFVLFGAGCHYFMIMFFV